MGKISFFLAVLVVTFLVRCAGDGPTTPQDNSDIVGDTVDIDTVVTDTVVRDTVDVDTVVTDTVVRDTVDIDTVVTDTVVRDTVDIDTVVTDTVVRDTVDIDTVVTDTVVRDTVDVDTVVTDTVVVDTVVRCVGLTARPGTQTRTITVNGRARQYVLLIPTAYSGDEPVPLILDFHGITGNGQGQRGSSTYPAFVGPEGVIMAFPTGLPGPMGNAWNVGPCCVADVDDVAFARAIVEDIKSIACIDVSRVYAVGFSMGGGMSHYLACNAADVFAAVAPAAFDLLEENVESCNPSRPITVVMFRGTAETLVPYDGGYSSVVRGMPITFMGAEATFNTWAQLNGCSGTPTNIGNGCMAYSPTQCNGGVEVVLCTEQGGGHEQGVASVGWEILRRHRLP